MGFTIGKQQTDDSSAQTALTHTASNIGAIDGNVIINAGGTYQQTGSSIVAGMGADSSEDVNDALDNSSRGNTVIRAQDINIDNVMDVYTNQSEQKFKQSGLTVSLSNSLIDSAKSIDNLIDAGGNTGSTRMKGMAGVAAGLKTKALAQQGSDVLSMLQEGGKLQDIGSTRIQATIGSSKSESNSSSYTEVNQGSSITTNNLALIATGAGTDSNININGSNLNVTNDALFQADNDLTINGVAQNSNTRSDNKSSSTAIGAYAATNPGKGASYGITASASRAKGYANSDSTTYANSQINVGDTTTFDIGNDVNIKGGVINTDRARGAIGGDMTIESLQDTATYDSKQKNMGFSADLDIAGGGAGSSLSVNGGKTDLNADYQAVGEQSGIFTGDGGLDLTAKGKTTLIGGAITTTEAARDAGRNNYESLGGIETKDIKNTTSYDGDAIQVGVSLGMTENKPQANSNGIGYGTDSDSDSSVTRAGITGIAGSQDITTDNRAEYAGILENNFDANQVNEELGAQVEITQAFDQERRKVKTEINKKEQKLRDAAEEQDKLGNTAARDTLIEQADKIQNQGLLFDAISGAIYGPNSNGATGYVAKVTSPFVASQIGTYFKANEVVNSIDGGNRSEQGSAAHILAQGILGAAVSYATGNDALTGGVSASAGEATAPIISDFLFDTKNPDELTAEQKDTLSSITSALGCCGCHGGPNG
ncbi:hemagglutinin repeat-containing protein [Psychrobacter sp. AOP29-E1-4]|uniref:hemagglutinin repeat-containing protein n=1 Tax=Psychrobacter sp. AOP29-E1-4 TaxID=3457703 RepID=UPI00403715D7